MLNFSVKTITGIKKAMTKTMTESLSIPFFVFSDEIDASKLIKLRKEMKASNPKLTLLPFFIKACSIAMTEYPIVNSQVDNDLDVDGFIQRYVIKHDHNFSIAIDSPDGLTVPNIKQCQTKSILKINDELKDLQTRASSGKLTATDFADATFSISSVGNIGGRYFVPTILRPQTAIIAIGKAHTYAKYREEEGDFVPAEAITFSISADHRVLDGATVARFATRMKQLIENPNLMLLNMH
jgi:2-oxoisovalerate dehydrogenase E2 component (dihydrolipoyl transacylase)